MTTTHDRWVE